MAYMAGVVDITPLEKKWGSCQRRRACPLRCGLCPLATAFGRVEFLYFVPNAALEVPLFHGGICGGMGHTLFAKLERCGTRKVAFAVYGSRMVDQSSALFPGNSLLYSTELSEKKSPSD
jgi:hypothetical protein